MGYAALQFDTTGDSDTGIGVKALQFNTTGSRNVAVGINAMSNNIDGDSNVAVGSVTEVKQTNDNNSIMIGDGVIGAGTNTGVIGNSSMTDIYFGSNNANATTHANTVYSGSSTVPGCIVIGDTAGGVGYVTLNSGVLTVSSTKPSTCQ